MQEELEVTIHSEFARKTLDEHHRLAETRSRLRHLLEDCISHPGRDKRRELHIAFRDFRVHLLEHMVFEEEGGFMAPLLEVRPNLAPRIEELEKEHEYLRMELEGLLISLESSQEFTRPVMDIVIRVANMLDFVEAHERVENGLVLDTFFQDTGNKD